MHILIVSDKPAQSRCLAPAARAHWPTANITFVNAVPFANLKFIYPRGLRLEDYPLLRDPIYQRSSWEDWTCPPLAMAQDCTLTQVAMSEELFTAADLIVYAGDPNNTSTTAFEVLMKNVFGDDRALACPGVWLTGIDQASLKKAFSNMKPFGELFRQSLEYGRMKRYFDWNWNVNALAVFGYAMRRVGVPADAPTLSKYALQLLYALRKMTPRWYGQIVTLTRYWPGTGRYQYQPGEWHPRLGSPTSVSIILDNLIAAGLLEEIPREASNLFGISARGKDLLDLLHPDCEDPDLPFRLDEWCKKGEESKPAVDRYLRAFFGKQLRFVARSA